MITINGKVYRNLQEQVGKNQEDIEDLQSTLTKVVVKDDDGNVDEVLKVAQLQSETGEDDDCKAKIYLSSGLRRSRITLESQGEETGSSIILQGTTSIGSEGTVEIAGETNFTTNARITVTDGNEDVEEIAYLSDIIEKVPDAPTEDGTYTLKVTVSDGTPTYSWILDI